MANFLDKFKITTATTRKHMKDLSCEHITSGDFMQFAPAYYHNMIPGEKLTIDFRAFSRLAPMPVPTFGRAHMNMRAFFVPFRIVFPAWNDFITDAIHPYPSGDSAVPVSTRIVTNQALLQLLRPYTTVTTSDVFDMEVTISANNMEKWVFDRTGRIFFKLLTSLGYALNPSFLDATSFNALPILCLCKVFMDWYYPSAYVGDPDYVALQKIIETDQVRVELDSTEVKKIFQFFFAVNYDSDYFVSAFDNPSGPSTGVSNSFNIVDTSVSVNPTTVINRSFSNTQGSSNGTPTLVGTGSSSTSSYPTNLSQYALDALKRLTSYLKRHQLAGARSLDRYLARFGVQLSADKLQRSLYLGSHTIPLMTGDVMATSNTLATGGDPLGSYSGKGFLVGKDGHFEFETDEFGLFFITYSIIPEIGYYQGIDRHNLHVTKLDFFTPEFDGMGTRAISSAELFVPQTDGSTASGHDWFGSVFGYTPQYSEYKVGRDIVSGDYRVPHLSAAGQTSHAWHLMRGFDEDQPIVHSKDFVRGYGPQYDRIFYNSTTDADHFFIHFFFGVKSYAPLKPLYDDYDWENEEGQSRILDVNGVKMN